MKNNKKKGKARSEKGVPAEGKGRMDEGRKRKRVEERREEEGEDLRWTGIRRRGRHGGSNRVC